MSVDFPLEAGRSGQWILPVPSAFHPFTFRFCSCFLPVLDGQRVYPNRRCYSVKVIR